MTPTEAEWEEWQQWRRAVDADLTRYKTLLGIAPWLLSALVSIAAVVTAMLK